ncbi:hypothetical protein H9C73_09480 [Marinobacterium sp. AK62]|uniref:Thioredoxin-like fold domain-containing protein n=1 Tax=Marinobacterium alkalitolerans TaxID=1542925 RepID=A0ABS3ZBD6_9GAMM|nr:hypothetical protein [Marinobacterium alkalitolerans]MBP0048969.1 hypothetical protein [Marinobacterium alkalitolerans]
MKWVLSACALLLSSSVAAQALQPLTSLKALDSMTPRPRAVLILFSQPDCRFCDLVREEFLVPLEQQPPQGLVIREYKVATAPAITDSDGSTLTPSAFASRYNVRFYPTVSLISPAGEPLADPLIGISSTDFYGYYLDQAINDALNAPRP